MEHARSLESFVCFPRYKTVFSVKITFPICFGFIRSYSKLLFHFLFDFEIFVFSKKKGRWRDHFGHGVTNFGHGVTNWSRQRPTTGSELETLRKLNHVVKIVFKDREDEIENDRIQLALRRGP